MKRVFIEAFEDESRPQGGHAVIVVQGLEQVSDRPQFRLKPLDGSFIAGKRSGPKSNMLTPVATRLTENGVELVVGPEIVSNPLLLAGTPVVIEIPDAGVRGEFLWPNVAPLAPPKRRTVVVAKKPRTGTGTAAEPAGAGIVVATEDLGLKVLEAAEQLESAIKSSPAFTGADTVEGPRGSGLPADLAQAAAGRDDFGIEIPSTGSPRSVMETRRSDATGNGVHWQGRQGAGRARRRRWLAPGLALCAGLGLVAAYVILDQSANPVSSAAVASDKSKPATVRPPVPAMDPTGTEKSTTPPGAGEPKTSVAALSPGNINSAPVCAKPEITTDPLDGGRMRIRFAAPCKGDEEVRLSYGGGNFVHRLDVNGALDLIFDCFAGSGMPVEVRFADGRTRSLPVVSADFARISKVAVLWKAPVNLDLHAYEYAALQGERGHVSERVPGTHSTALREAEAARRGRGFMSSSDGGRSLGDKLEVYTFFHSDDQSTGTIDFALDFETRGDNPAAGTCGTDEHAEVPFKVSLLSRGKPAVIEDGRIAAAECGARIGPEARFVRGALPVLKVRK